MNRLKRISLAGLAVALMQFTGTGSALAQTNAVEASAANDGVVMSFQAPLRGILILPDYNSVKVEGVTGVQGVEIRGPEFLKTAKFEKLLTGYLGKPLTFSTLKRLQIEIIRYARDIGHPVVDVHLAEQEALEDTVQIAVIEAKIGKVTVENEGHKWFSDELVSRQFRLQPGDVVRSGVLNDDLSWLSQNSYQSLGVFEGSFREVTASFSQGLLGEADVKVKVKDRFPLRPFIGYEDSGFEVIGKERYFAGFNYANVFGLDHRLNYQFTADTSFDLFRSHAASYVVPLPWRHELILFGAYADLQPDYKRLSDTNLANFKNDGSTYQISARYVVPLPDLGKLEHALTAGFDFKRTDTPLLFTGVGILQTNKIDVAQFSLDWSGRLRDKFGGTAVSLQGVYSPGGLTRYNDQSDFTEFAPGSDVDYFYGRLELRRETRLPLDFLWSIRATGQYSDSELVPSELFGLGGWATIRGYNERVVNSSDGWLIINELRTPQFTLGNLTGREEQRDWIQGLVFLDYGRVINKHPFGGYNYDYTLLSVGLGFRYQLADNLHFRFDYGFQLDDGYKNAPSAQLEKQPDGRGHIGLEISY
jgi:hemolysin activation/secretion protein